MLGRLEDIGCKVQQGALYVNELSSYIYIFWNSSSELLNDIKQHKFCIKMSHCYCSDHDRHTNLHVYHSVTYDVS